MSIDPQAPRSLLRSTLRALLAPRRATALAVVVVPLVIIQARLSTPSEAWARAAALGLVMCVACVLLAPLTWRALFPAGEDRPPTWSAPFGRLVVYATTGAGVVSLIGVVLPKLVGVGETLMTTDVGLLVSVALFLVGGYGLGRDIDLESGLRAARAEVVTLARQAEHARLLALRSQLDPHFLFNTLNAIAEWCREDGEVAEQATLRLSEMLRAILEASRLPAWPIAREITLGRMLFELHAVRDPGAFEVAWKTDELPGVTVPPMILLPLCENAMKHGVGAGHRGTIEVGAKLDGDGVLLWVDNPGRYAGPRIGGEGIASVAQRLELAYAGAATMTIDGEADRTRVRLRLPSMRPKEEA
jgi:two-component system sensor histidine kinase AlgZ